MKKSLIALAALSTIAGSVAAQSSSVTLYGAYGNSVTSTKTAGVNVNSQAQNASRDHLSTTALGIKGTEDLGNGMSAFFVLEGDLSGNGVLGSASTTAGTSETTNIFNRHAHAGLKTNFGTLTAGRQNDSVKDTEGLAQVYNLSDNLANKTRVGDRIANAVKYATPTWNGLSATYTHSNNPADATLDASNSTTDHNSWAINYKLPVNGGIDLAYAEGEHTSAGAQTAKTTRLSARTKVMGVDVGAAYTTNQAASTAEKTKQTLVSVNKSFGNIDLKAHYWNNDASAGVGNADDGFDGNGYGFMGVYNLSKRTAVYAGYSDFNATAVANESKVTTVGLVHKF